jgi:hypothetical protein
VIIMGALVTATTVRFGGANAVRPLVRLSGKSPVRCVGSGLGSSSSALRFRYEAGDSAVPARHPFGANTQV